MKKLLEYAGRYRYKIYLAVIEIMVINNGKIQERGNHQELMENKGTYATFIGKRDRKVG